MKKKLLILGIIGVVAVIGVMLLKGSDPRGSDPGGSIFFKEGPPLPTRQAVDVPEEPAAKEGIIRVTVAKLKPVEDNMPLVSAGIPFAPGQLMDARDIAFYSTVSGGQTPVGSDPRVSGDQTPEGSDPRVSGGQTPVGSDPKVDPKVKEIPIATKVLARWPQDSSIRSILVQFKYPIEKRYQYLAMRWGHPRKTEDLQIVEPRWDYPAGFIVLPPQWLCDSKVIGEQVPMGQRIVPEYDQNIVEFFPDVRDEPWTGKLIEDGFYSTPHTFYQLYVRSGALSIFLSARKELLHYRETQIIHEGKNTGASTAGLKPRYVYMQAMADDYFLTGDPRTLEIATEMAAYLKNNFHADEAFYSRNEEHYWTERRQAFLFLGLLTYYEMTGDEKYLELSEKYMQNLYKTQLQWPGRGGFIHNLYAHDPEEGARKDEYGGSPFMTGFLLEPIIKYHRLTKSPIAADSIFRALEWLIKEGLSPTKDAFRYLTAGKYIHDRGQPDLSPLVVHAFGYGYKMSGYKDKKFLDIGMKVFLRSVDEGFVERRKHFNQGFRSSGHFLAYIQEGILRLQGFKKGIPIKTDVYQNLFSDFLSINGAKPKEEEINVRIYKQRPPATFYVSQKGTIVGGCTIKHPCQEIGRAISLATPGDTIVIQAGDYKAFQIRDVRGTKENPIIIKAESEVRVFPDKTREDNRDNIDVLNCDWLIFDGLSSFDAARAGMLINHSHHITVRNGVFGNNRYWGIFAGFCNDILLENNECYGSKVQHGIYVANSGDRPTVRKNVLYNNYQCGVQLNADLSEGGGRNVKRDGVISNAMVEDNFIYDNGIGGGSAINLDGVQDSIIRNNVLYNNHASGIAVYKIDAGQGPKNLKIYNNTVVMARDARWAMVVHETLGPIFIKNNIFYNKNPRRGGLSIGDWPTKWNKLMLGLLKPSPEVKDVYSDYNIFGGGKGVVTTDGNETRFNLRIWQKTGNDKHSRQVGLEQIFKDEGKDQYELMKNSVAVDAGVKVDEVTDDIKGTPRPQGKKYDIGAFEVPSSRGTK